MNQVLKEQKEVVVKPCQNIVASMADSFRDELLALFKQGTTNLVIDLEGVELVDSVGLGVFIAAHNSLASVNGSLTICNASKDIYQLFKIMRLDQHFTIKVSDKE